MSSVLLLDANIADLINIFKTEMVFNYVLHGLGILLAGFGLFFSVKAFKEAGKAKDAAKEAGKTVKIQTMTVDLMEIMHLIEKPSDKIDYYIARDYLDLTRSKINRITASFKQNERYTEVIDKVQENLRNARTELDNNKPAPGAPPAPQGTIYFAIESHFSDLRGNLSELMGLLEDRNLEV